MEGDWLARVQKWTQEQYNEWLSKLPVDISGVHLAIIAAAGCAMIILGIIARRPLRMMLLHRQIDKRIRGMERRGGTLAVLELLWQDVMRRYGALKPDRPCASMCLPCLFVQKNSGKRSSSWLIYMNPFVMMNGCRHASPARG